MSAEAYIATGDPIFCKQCHAAFSTLSKLVPLSEQVSETTAATSEEQKDGKGKGKEKEKETEEAEPQQEEVREGSQVWVCEFCETKNIVFIESEEMPGSDTMDFIIRPASRNAEDADMSSTVFCIDASGSMYAHLPSQSDK